MAIAPEKVVGSELIDIYEKVDKGQRLSFEDGLRLYRTPNLTAVGYMANVVRERRHGAKTYYVRNQHINYTNICNKFCKFCSFYAKKGGPKPYEMSLEEVQRRLDWHRDIPITEIHMVGGINPRLPYQYYLDLVRLVKNHRREGTAGADSADLHPLAPSPSNGHGHPVARGGGNSEAIGSPPSNGHDHPAARGGGSSGQSSNPAIQQSSNSEDVHVKAFTAVEIVEIARVGKCSIEKALADLIEAGLDSLPGGGIEILSDRVHSELFGKKLNGEEWKDVARAAAKLNLKQYATMLYGHIETDEERVDHLIQLRELQDETGHFLTMTPLSFHPEGTELEDIAPLTADVDLRNIALSRLMLDNFEHIKSFWIMNTVPVTQAALWYGADDADGLVHEYEITYKDGEWGNKSQALTHANMIAMIEEVGRIPVERDSLYNEIVREPSSLEPGDRSPSRVLLPMATG